MFFGDNVEMPDSEDFAKKRFIIDFQDGDLAYYLADPRNLPIIGSVMPPEISRDAKVWRRSWMRTAGRSAFARTSSQNRLMS